MKIGLASIAALVAALPLGMRAQAAVVVVSPGDMQGWGFVEEVATGTGTLTLGPAVPPLGTGSARLTVDSTGREILGTQAYAGTALADIDVLTYSTYRSSGSAALAISLQLDIDYDLTDSNTAWQGRLIYEPYYTNTVLTGVWQSWDTLTPAGTGNWWASGAPGNSVCPINNPCTWNELLANFPNAGIRANGGVLQLKAGGPWSGGFDGNADALEIGVSGVTTTYDFEPCQADSECDDGNTCTADSCDPMSGCIHDPAPREGMACTDGNPCTEADACSGGTCVGTIAADDDGDGYCNAQEQQAGCDPADPNEIPPQSAVFSGSTRLTGGGGEILLTYHAPSSRHVSVTSEPACAAAGTCSSGICTAGKIGNACSANTDCDQPAGTCRVIVNYAAISDLALVEASLKKRGMPPADVSGSFLPATPGCSRKVDIPLGTGFGRARLKLKATGTANGHPARDRDRIVFTE